MSPLVLKQKRGPGFKYASNLPGSLLREQKPVKEEVGDVSSATKRRPDREETPRFRPEEPLHRLPPLLSPSNLPRPRPEDKLRKKRKLFDDDEEEDLGVRKKVCVIHAVADFVCDIFRCTLLRQTEVILIQVFFFFLQRKSRTILIFPNFCTESRPKRRTTTHITRRRMKRDGGLPTAAFWRGKGPLETPKKKGMKRTPRMHF